MRLECFPSRSHPLARAGRPDRGSRRRGAAVVEFAILLPFLMFLFVVTIDYSRIFYFSQVVDECARAGALYASDPSANAGSPYRSTAEAALGSAPASLRPTLQVTTATGSDTSGSYTSVTVHYTFKSITKYPLIPHTVDVTRTTMTRVAPNLPR